MFKKISFLLFCLPIAPLFAALPQTTSPIEISSDSAIWDQNTKQAIHKGNVIMTQGDKTLLADEIILEKNASDHVEKLIAKGNPASFEGSLESSQPTPIKGHAQTIIFFPNKERLILKGQAELKQAQSVFKGPEVAFDFVSKQITAESSQSGRPTLTYQPQTP